MNPEELKKNISELPSGGITIKRIKNAKTGDIYEYHVYQWRENGKQKSRYLQGEEIQKLADLIERRKQLQRQLSEITKDDSNKYLTDIQTGDALRRLVKGVENYKKREIISQLKEYVYSDEFNRVFILYGLRRTGKTTMMKQIITEMDEEHFNSTAFIQINSTNNLGQLNQDLNRLRSSNYRYIFLDEVTMMDDFIEGAALLSDIYAASGMKIVLSGTDSLGFWISKSNQLFDRCYLLHTTFIPYREFENVLEIKGIDSYIQYGGTMCASGERYNIFANESSTDEYIDSAIAKNIQHSLRCYQDEGHFRHLYSLYEHNELTSAINRVVEDINHRFTVDVLTRQFKSSDLSISARNLRKENNVLDLIDRETVTKRLKELLEIKNKDEQKIEIDSTHEKEIKEYLEALDLIKEIKIVDIEYYGKQDTRVVFTQAGLRYCQAEALVNSLMQDEIFSALSFDERKRVNERILNEVKGRMMEDIVLIETAQAYPNKEVFKLQFADGEYDMVVFDPKNGGCTIYEIKHSGLADDNQIRHLVDGDKIKKTEFRFGKVSNRYVLYRGAATSVQNIQYLNVEEYLKELKA